jgi:hypothetical protein
MSCPSANSPTLLLSLATAPFLVGLLAARALAQTLIDVGQASEEVFRGDRLPVLRCPHPDENSPTVS